MKRYTKLALLFSLAYFTSYITRINFGAIISEMVSDTGFTKELLSLSVTGSFVTYGVGQIVSGILGDKISPKKLVFYGFIITVLMNIAIPFCKSPYLMAEVWCVNGFAQSLMWPPIVKLMTVSFTEEEYKNVCQKVILGSSVATVVIYLLSPVLIALMGWKSVFFFSAICGVTMILIWQKYCEDVKNAPSALNNTKKKTEKLSLMPLFCPAMVCVMVAIICQGMLRDGITTWMPTYISETYNLGNEIGILTGVILPLFSIVAINVTTSIYKKIFTNPVVCAGFVLGIGAVSCTILTFVTGKSAIFSVLLSALITGCMHGANLMLVCMIPPFFKKFGNVSSASGIINSFTYVGSALSTYGIAAISENFGWSITLNLWVLIALLGSVFCLISFKSWKKKFM